MKWSITIDQISESGGLQRYGPTEEEGSLPCAVECAIKILRFEFVESGSYQITAEIVEDTDSEDLS